MGLPGSGLSVVVGVGSEGMVGEVSRGTRLSTNGTMVSIKDYTSILVQYGDESLE